MSEASQATLDEVKRLVAEGKLTPQQISFRMGVAVGVVKRMIEQQAKGKR